MGTIKKYIYDNIQENPSRYGVDNGDLHLINDYFVNQGWHTLTREQHKAIAALIRLRNYFLQENEAYDMRIQKTVYEHIGQKTIFDYMDNETALESKKLVRYWSADPERIKQTKSRIKKSVRGVDDDHIIAAKVMYPLLRANPRIQVKRRRRKGRDPKALNNVSINGMETENAVGYKL